MWLRIFSEVPIHMIFIASSIQLYTNALTDYCSLLTPNDLQRLLALCSIRDVLVPSRRNENIILNADATDRHIAFHDFLVDILGVDLRRVVEAV